MNAVDTNVLVRLLIDEDVEQSRTARALLRSQHVWIAKTVLLETAWVLKSVYSLDGPTVNAALKRVLGLANVRAEDHAVVAEALRLTDEGLDFADALHLCSRPAGVRFMSFDRALVRRANRAGLRDVVDPHSSN